MHSMLLDHIAAALEHARYEFLDDAEYGKAPELPEVSPTGRTLEECRRSPAGVLDERRVNGSGAGSRPPRLPEHRLRPLFLSRHIRSTPALTSQTSALNARDDRLSREPPAQSPDSVPTARDRGYGPGAHPTSGDAGRTRTSRTPAGSPHSAHLPASGAGSTMPVELEEISTKWTHPLKETT